MAMHIPLFSERSTRVLECVIFSHPTTRRCVFFHWHSPKGLLCIEDPYPVGRARQMELITHAGTRDKSSSNRHLKLLQGDQSPTHRVRK